MANWTSFCPRQLSDYIFHLNCFPGKEKTFYGRLDLIVLDLRYIRLVNALFPYRMFTLVLCSLTYLSVLENLSHSTLTCVYLLWWCFEIGDWIYVSKGVCETNVSYMYSYWFTFSIHLFDLITDLVLRCVAGLGGSDMLNTARER